LSRIGRKPITLPQIGHLLYDLTAYLGFCLALCSNAFLDIYSNPPYRLKGMPSSLRRLMASSSVLAVETMVTFIPRTLATLS